MRSTRSPIASAWMAPLAAAVSMLGPAAVHAQEVLLPPNESHVRLPLVMLGNGNYPGMPCVEARIGGRKALFFLDTGMNQSAVEKGLAEELDLVLSGHDFVFGIGGSSKRKVYRAVPIEVGAASFETRLLFALPLKRFSTNRDRDIEGLLGGDFFASSIVTIDVRKGEVVLHDRDQYQPPETAVEIKLSSSLGQPETRAAIDDGRALRYMVDTGAEMNLILNSPFVARYGLLRESERLIAMKVRGHNKSGDVHCASLARFGLGDFVTANMPAVLMGKPDGIGLGGDQRRAGIIGLAFLAKARVTFDIRGRRMFIESKNGQMTPSPPTGLLLKRHEDRKVTILDVMEWSERPKLDIRSKDRLVAVGGKPVPDSLHALYDLLQSQVESVLTLERGGEQHEVTWPRIEQLPRVTLQKK